MQRIVQYDSCTGCVYALVKVGFAWPACRLPPEGTARLVRSAVVSRVDLSCRAALQVCASHFVSSPLLVFIVGMADAVEPLDATPPVPHGWVASKVCSVQEVG